MGLKRIAKRGLIKIAESSAGPKVQEIVRGMSEILELYGGREFRARMNRNLSLESILDNAGTVVPADKVTGAEPGDASEKIKIRFFHCLPACYNVIKTITAEFQKDQKYDVLMVLFGEKCTALAEQMRQEGLRYVISSDYSLKQDRPDISVAYHLEIAYPPELRNLRAYSKRLVLVPLSIGSIWFGDRTVSRMHLDEFKPDICFIGNLCYDRLKPVIGADVIEKMSPPQFDLAYDYLKEKTNHALPDGWNKLKNKKTVMLMTDHGLKKSVISDEVSFDLYFMTLITYFRSHQDMCLILRPHFELISELIRTYWSISDYQRFVRYCVESENIIWDETEDYLIGLSVADACLVDVNCSLVYYVLASNKPIGVPLRFDMPVEINNPDLVSVYYQVKSKSDMVEFLEMVRNGLDPKQAERQDAFNRYITTFDGNNGKRIKETIDRRIGSAINESEH